MPLSVTHVLLAIIALDLYRDYILKNKKDIPLSFIFYGGIAGLLPDIDVPLTWLLNSIGILGNFHRLFTHSFLFSLVFLIISFIFIKLKNKKYAIFFGIVTFGVFFHILLDAIFTDAVMIFYPLTYFAWGFDLFGKIGFFAAEAGLDAFILLAWLYHEEKKHKISDFI